MIGSDSLGNLVVQKYKNSTPYTQPLPSISEQLMPRRDGRARKTGGDDGKKRKGIKEARVRSKSMFDAGEEQSGCGTADSQFKSA